MAIICNEWGKQFEDEMDIRIVYGKTIHRLLCEFCVGSLEGSGNIIRCENCGDLFNADMLHDERLDDTHTFTACPHCGHDVVDGTTREEALAEVEAKTYAPTFRCEIEAQTPLDVLRLMQRVHYGLHKGQKDGEINDQGRVVGRWQFNEGGV